MHLLLDWFQRPTKINVIQAHPGIPSSFFYGPSGSNSRLCLDWRIRYRPTCQRQFKTLQECKTSLTSQSWSIMGQLCCQFWGWSWCQTYGQLEVSHGVGHEVGNRVGNEVGHGVGKRSVLGWSWCWFLHVMTCLSPKSQSLCQNCKVAVRQSAQGVGKELKKTPDQVTRQILYWISWSFPGQTGKALERCHHSVFI